MLGAETTGAANALAIGATLQWGRPLLGAETIAEILASANSKNYFNGAALC